MDNLYIKTKNLKDDVSKKLDEMDQIFNLTKSFSGHFDIHVNKLQSLVLSLLITDFDDFEDTDFDFKNDKKFNLGNLNKEDKIENIIQKNHFSDRVFTKNNANRIIDINPNYSTIEHIKDHHSHNETMKKDNNNQLAFVEIFKEQNSNLVKMMETGQENSKTLREMFNSIYEAFLSQSKQVPESELRNKYNKKKNSLKKKIEELEKENMDLKIKSSRLVEDGFSNYDSTKFNKIQEENLELGKEINKMNNFNLILKEKNLKLINDLEKNYKKTEELKKHVKEMEINLNDLSMNILNYNPSKNLNTNLSQFRETFSTNLNSSQETNNKNVEKILETNLELIELIKKKNENSRNNSNKNVMLKKLDSFSNPFEQTESIDSSKKTENLILIDNEQQSLNSFGNFDSKGIPEKRNSLFKNIFKDENQSEKNEPSFNVIIDTNNNSEEGEETVSNNTSNPREKRESVNTFIQMNSVDSDPQSNLFRSETHEKYENKLHKRVHSGDKQIVDVVAFAKKDNECIFIKGLPLPGSEKF